MLQNSYNQEIIKTSDSLVNILPISKERKFIHTVSFIWIWLIFIRNNLCLKSPLKMNLSPSSTSFPLGLLIRTRALPQASDCNVLRNSLSSGWGEKCRHRLALKWMTLNKNERNHTLKCDKQRHSLHLLLNECLKTRAKTIHSWRVFLYLSQWPFLCLQSWIRPLHWTWEAPESGRGIPGTLSFP